MGSYQPIRRVAVIGAGPSGLATAKYLLAEKCFDRVDVFEQRGRVGGIWNLSSPEKTKRIPIPQTHPSYGNLNSNAQWLQNDDSQPPESLELESPLYDYLETNIPKQLMGYSNTPFPEDAPLFVGHEATLEYLERYAKPIRDLIHFNTQVQVVKQDRSSSDLGKRWEVRTQNLCTGEKMVSIYDAVIVASGHYTIPFVPEVKGLKEWDENYPGIVIHSKAYRKPEYFKDKKVLIIGNSVSGLDIASQIGPLSRKVLLSSRSMSIMGAPPPVNWCEDFPSLSEFLPSSSYNRAIKFADGRVESDIDAIIFATGYFYNFPFLDSLDPPLVTHGFRTEHLYKHVFYIDNPTLAFLVLNLKVIPFPLAENQASVVARIWSGRLSLPSKPEMAKWEEKTIAEQGSGKDFHLLKFPKDAEAVNEFYEWAKAAKPMPELEDKGIGKLGTFWDKRLVWMRSKFPEIKAAYARLGDKRYDIRTVEELGFDFEMHVQAKEGGATGQVAEHV